MSLTEVADYLKIAKAELAEMAETGGIPGTKVQSQWQFMRSIVDDWLIDYMKRLSKEDLHRLIASEGGPVSLKTLVRPDLVSASVRPGLKREVLEQLVQVPQRAGHLSVPEAERLLERLIDREEMVSTAIFAGVALPHPRNPEEPLVKRPTVIIGICRAGTDFDSLDMAPTHVFFVICAGNEILHLKLVAELALHLRRRDLVPRLMSAAGPEAAVAELFG
jgi:excisionase family DNA binding protein